MVSEQHESVAEPIKSISWTQYRINIKEPLACCVPTEIDGNCDPNTAQTPSSVHSIARNVWIFNFLHQKMFKSNAKSFHVCGTVEWNDCILVSTCASNCSLLQKCSYSLTNIICRYIRCLSLHFCRKNIGIANRREGSSIETRKTRLEIQRKCNKYEFSVKLKGSTFLGP